ncbi:hypothetical protein [Amycolatopsis taiwanensis]|uniref:Uncharacterized protein n=1 Tax=Amycolatopsis taiwanensis TaxID=342230 RepID=A0A9W6VB97_9PSEU|nr:hypothetical protein [Amycolatopsis taiwanensis]GLY64718.1 hypothetical protein Atai01_13370 [Amycolatopsis taiwanensis]
MTVTMATRQATARDLSVNAAVLGVAATVWFGWAQEAPPAGWSLPLGIGSGTGVLIAVLAGVSAWRSWRSGSAMADASGRRTYNWAVGAEVVAIAVGVVALALIGQSAYLAPWILFVVGTHFVPLGDLFVIRSLKLAGVLLAVVSAVAVVVGLMWTVTPSAVAGGAGGVVLVAFAIWALLKVWR